MAKRKDSLSKVSSSMVSSEDPIKCCWEDVVINGIDPRSKVRVEVLKSWIECRELGLDPYEKSRLPILSKNVLNSLLRKNKELIEISKPVMEMIEISVRDTGFIVTLTNKDGYVLVMLGDRDIVNMAKQNDYIPGCLRAVEHAGTNAIGLSIDEGRPIQLTGAEHYKIHHHPWTCSSAPIHNSQGQIIGAITLSGRSIGRHKHTLALVTAAAETVESQLRERDLIDERKRLTSMLTLIFNSISDGVIAIDNHSNITRMNSTGEKMLGVSSKDVIGRPLDESFQPEERLLTALRNKDYFKATETIFICPKGQKRYICSVDPVKDASERILGAIITMAAKKQVINIAKKIGGNYAKYQFEDIKGNNQALLKQIDMAKIAARTNSRVLIIGESGTGKELFAQAIHNFSNRSKEPFVAISCAAIPRDLIESELFGYRGGAFTGARREGQVGKFELAHKGTLFLDEVNGLPLDLQSKLLRTLQQGEITRLGDVQPIQVDVRVIAASNLDLMTEVENKNFREDLYYRLNVVEIFIPSLNQRIEDLELLIDHILKRHCQEMDIDKPLIDPKALKILMAYHWPGNVRELENCIERALLLSQGQTIQVKNLPDRVRKSHIKQEDRPVSLKKSYKKLIIEALERSGGNISITARELKIARSTLYRKMKEFDIS